MVDWASAASATTALDEPCHQTTGDSRKPSSCNYKGMRQGNEHSTMRPNAIWTTLDPEAQYNASERTFGAAPALSASVQGTCKGAGIGG